MQALLLFCIIFFQVLFSSPTEQQRAIKMILSPDSMLQLQQMLQPQRPPYYCIYTVTTDIQPTHLKFLYYTVIYYYVLRGARVAWRLV